MLRSKRLRTRLFYLPATITGVHIFSGLVGRIAQLLDNGVIQRINFLFTSYSC